MAEDFTAWVFALAAIPLFVVLVARYPATFLAALVPSQILLGGMERGALVPGLRPGELVLGLSLAGLVLSPRWRFHRAVRGPLNSWVALYGLTGLVIPLLAWTLRGHSVTLDAIQSYASVGKALLVYFAIAPLVIADGELETTLHWAFWSAVLSAAVAVLQRADVPMVNSLLLGYYKSQHLYEGLAGHTSRPSGLAGNWHALGLEFMMALVLGWLALRRQSAERPWVLGAGMFLLLFGIAAVATITSIVLVLAFFGVVLWRALDSLAPGPRASLRGLLVAALLVTSTSLVLYLAAGRSVYLNTLIPASLYVRLYDWLFVYGPIIRSHLLLGYGPSLPEVAARSDDSQFVLFLLRGGVVSLFGWLVATGGILRWCRREGGYNESQVGVARVAFVFTAALVGASLMQSFFTYTGVVEWYWATIGVASARRSLRPGDAVTSAQRSI